MVLFPCTNTIVDDQTNNSIIARHDAPERDAARHSLTIKQASQLFADLQAPRAPRSVQRFCDVGYLDCVRVRGAKGDRFFVSRVSVEKYAEELRQISAIASIGAEARTDALERDEARQSTPPHSDGTSQRENGTDTLGPESKRLADENINLRIDNRAKEQVINMLVAERREAQTQLQDMRYRLGTAESRLAQLDAPEVSEDLARQDAPERAPKPASVIVEAVVPDRSPDAADLLPEIPSRPVTTPRRSFFGRLLGK